MAELQIRLDVDPTTGKKNITISYRSDEDALPLEHEDEHRRLVNALIEGGALKAAEVGQIIVEREQEVGTFDLEQEREGAEQPEAVEQEQ